MGSTVHKSAWFDLPSPVEHKNVVVDGVKIFYREAGARDAPVIVLLHGFPSSSRMFLTLFPCLSSRYRLIAPDYPGFGHSDAPSRESFAYTFDHLACVMERFLAEIGVDRYTLYLQDYGGPIGFRLAVAHPQRVEGIVIQNAVAHIEGLSDAWTARNAFWRDRAQHEDKMRGALLSLEGGRQRHLSGVSNAERIDPDTWADEFVFLGRQGMSEIQLDLMFDYQSNVASYPAWQAYLREKQPPLLVVWGKHDPLFTVAGALAFGNEVPDAAGSEVGRRCTWASTKPGATTWPLASIRRMGRHTLQTPVSSPTATMNPAWTAIAVRSWAPASVARSSTLPPQTSRSQG